MNKMLDRSSIYLYLCDMNRIAKPANAIIAIYPAVLFIRNMQPSIRSGRPTTTNIARGTRPASSSLAFTCVSRKALTIQTNIPSAMTMWEKSFSLSRSFCQKPFTTLFTEAVINKFALSHP